MQNMQNIGQRLETRLSVRGDDPRPVNTLVALASRRRKSLLVGLGWRVSLRLDK